MLQYAYPSQEDYAGWSQQIGAPVTDLRPAALPTRPITLHGKYIDLSPPCLPDHLDEWWEAFGKSPINDPSWTYMLSGPFPDQCGAGNPGRAAFDKAMLALLPPSPEATGHHFFSLIPKVTNLGESIDPLCRRAQGRFALMRPDLASRSVEVGHVILGVEGLAKSRAATEAFFLVMRYVFDGEDVLRNEGVLTEDEKSTEFSSTRTTAPTFRRLEWKCHSLNVKSRRAAARLGFTFEGIFRNHYIVKGRSRDSAWFSIIEEEWPTRKRAFQLWLDESNFEDGKQVRKLEECREQAEKEMGSQIEVVHSGPNSQ